jgi:cellulose synthase (UDP-forming)
MINTFCHLQAVVDALRGHVAAWVPTGAARTAKKKKGNIPLRTAVIARVWFGVSQTLLWAGIVRAIVLGVNPIDMWPTILLAAIQFAMLAPVFLTLRPARASAPASPERAPLRVSTATSDLVSIGGTR